MASWQDYLKLMRSLSKTLGDLTEVEHDKNAAAARGDLRGVEECMKREQVLSLTLRGYDQKRDSLLRDLGITGVRLSTLVTKAVAEELRRQYALFQTASEVARNTLECNLRAIERAQAVQAGDAVQAEEQRKNHQTDFRA